MLTFYKPNRANKGALVSVNFQARTGTYQNGKLTKKGDKATFFSFVSQNGWDEVKQNGIFSGGKKCNIKFSDNEVAGIIAAIKYNMTLANAMGAKSVYHDGEETATTINFGPNFKKVKQEEKWVDTDEQTGFRLSATKSQKQGDSKETFAITFNWAETERLMSFLTTALQHINEALRADDIKNLQSRKVASTIEPAPEAPAEEPAETESATNDEPDW